MARVEGLDIGTPSILGDSFDVLERPRKQKGVEVAQVPPELEIEIQRRTPAAPKEPVTPKPGPGEAIREQGRIKMEREERERAETEAKKAAAKAGAAAVAGRRAEIRAEYEPKLAAPAPTFESPRESFNQLGSIAAMMMVMGTMAGGKGLASATGAMNAMAGMLQGYQTGRKEAYQQARLDYERSYKEWLQNKKNIKDAFDRALKMAPTDVQGATNKVVAELSSTGANTLAAAVKTQGLVPTANMFAEASDKADREIESINSVIRRMSGEQPTEVGVQLAGEVPTGTPLTIQELRRREQELGTEIKAQEAERRAAPRAPTARGGADPQFVVVEGFNNNQPFRATREERDRITGAGFNIQYVPPPKAEKKEGGRITPTTSVANRFDANVASIDDMLKIVKQSGNERLKKEWQDKQLYRLLSEPMSDTVLAKYITILARENLSPEARDLAEMIMNARNAVFRANSGLAVTGSEAIRNFGAVVNPMDSFDDIMRKAKNQLDRGLSNQDDFLDGYAFPEVYRKNAERRRKEAEDAFKTPPRSEPSVQTRPEPSVSPEDQRALQWLQTNPTHPRAEEIRKRLRDKGVQVQ
jgi:hypothetical protein